MDSEVEVELRQAGWFPNRRVSDEQVNEWLRMGVRNLGCRIFPEAVRVLREYGGLTFGDLHFTPAESEERGDHFQWLYWEWRTKEVLFPIGYELGGVFTFALSTSGKIYGSGTAEIFCGDSFEEFLANLVAHRKGRINWIENTPLILQPQLGHEY